MKTIIENKIQDLKDKKGLVNPTKDVCDLIDAEINILETVLKESLEKFGGK